MNDQQANPESHESDAASARIDTSFDAEMVDLEAVLNELSIEEVVKERDEFKDIALRVQADFENYRKRVSAQVADEVDRTSGKIIGSLLGVLDACEAAMGHGIDGVEPVWSALLGALQKQGLEVLDLHGKVFDPSVAEAVLHEEGDGTEPTVTEVLRTGYRWKGRVLRAAMVKVQG